VLNIVKSPAWDEDVTIRHVNFPVTFMRV